MDINEILKVVNFILVLIIGGFGLYYQTNAKLNKKVDEFIAEAEEKYKDATKAGGVKFTWVVDQLYSIVPTFLKPIITRTNIENLVQFAFDKIEGYAVQQLDKVLNKTKIENEKDVLN